MNESRRHFLKMAGAVAGGFSALKMNGGCERQTTLHRPDPRKVFDLPEGFEYTVISRTGELMDDGLLVPGAHDGMATFVGEGGKTIIVRNHELTPDARQAGAFGPRNELLRKLDQALLYDYGSGKKPGLGGTTTLVYDTRTRKLEKHFLSLAGTIRNCAGGPTPWNSWISCEETVQQANEVMEKDHGYNFEVPARADGGCVRAEPLTAMGRFNHEAVAVDARTGIVYETEDRDNGLIYRYIPDERGQLVRGGRLQALRLKDWARADTRNWRKTTVISPGASLAGQWMDLENIESPDDDLRLLGYYAKGCARFARGEGMWTGKDGIYFACTSGGPKKNGQIWRYVPSPYEGSDGESGAPGKLELFVEPADGKVCRNADNLTVSPWGDLFVCEDKGGKEQALLRITPAGRITRFGKNALNSSELAGVCFSPDGTTLFVNIQTPGLTLAIMGPWESGLGVLA